MVLRYECGDICGLWSKGGWVNNSGMRHLSCQFQRDGGGGILVMIVCFVDDCSVTLLQYDVTVQSCHIK